MISWIVASHDQGILERNLLATLQMPPEDELVLVTNAPSITVAYTEGQQRAQRPVHCFVHHDVQVLNLTWLRDALINSTENRDLVGMIGSRTLALPWENGEPCGSVIDTRIGSINFGPGGECVLLDGLLLATRAELVWDIEWPGWHGYDYDICTDVRSHGGTIWCLTGGHQMVAHNSDSAFALEAVDGWTEAAARYRAKWL